MPKRRASALPMPGPVTRLFNDADARLLGLQELLCANAMTHVADKVDVHRRALRTAYDVEIERRRELEEARRVAPRR